MKTKVTLLMCLVLALVCLLATSCDGLFTNPGDTTTAATTTETPATTTAPVTDPPATTTAPVTTAPPVVIDPSTIVFADKEVDFNKNSHTIEVTGLPEGVTADVECDEGEAVWPGEYTFIATFTVPEGADPIAPKTATLTINKAAYRLVGVSFSDKTVTYDGNSHALTLTGNLPAALTVSYQNNTLTDAGEVTATATFAFTNPNDAQGYEIPSPLTATLTVNKANIDMTGIPFADTTLPFTGEPQTLTIPLSALPAGVTVAYTADEGDVSIVTGSVTITATFTVSNGNYNVPAPVQATLTIGKGVYNMTGIYPTEESVVYTGSDLISAADAIGTLPTGVTLAETTVTKDGEPHTGAILNVGTYVITRSFTTSDANYNAPANVVTTLTVTPKDADLSALYWEGRDGFVADGSEKTVSLAGLPSYVQATYGGTYAATDTGSYTATATLASTDPNYKIPDGYTVEPLEWEIAGQKVDMTGFVFEGATYTYDGTAKTALTSNASTIAGIASVTYSVTKDGQPFEGDIINAGVYVFTATFEVEDTYAKVQPRTATLTVNQAEIDVSVATWDYFDGKFSVKDPGAKTVALTGVPAGVEVTYGGTYTVAEGINGDFVATASFTATDAVNYKIVGSVADLEWGVDNWSGTVN